MKSLRAQFADFAASKPAGEEYDFFEPGACALHQFGEATGMNRFMNAAIRDMPIDLVNASLDLPMTFGGLAERLKAGT